ncbi:trypsin-like peptidase domain-containing protein, partial [Streptomyces sp. B1866]|uniref:S1C family serine protease n=1 Tax=Streptomyces sp. B1866 TaxID=3075431 RepID=UPI00288F22D4
DAAGRARGRRRGAALLAAVALVAALAGGGTAALVSDSQNTTARPSAGAPAVNANASSSGSVAAVAAAVSPSIVEISATTADGRSTGSGVIVTADGEIVTNNHVIAGADAIQVTFSDGSKKSATVVGTDSAKDLALVKVSGASGLKAATLGDSDSVRVGDQVVAIGSPEGLTGTVTSGIVSALNREVTVPRDESRGRQGDGRWPFQFGGGEFNGDVGRSTTTYKAIQTDASLNPGNSGGALINMKGEVIGINSAMYAPAGATSSATAGSVGLGFAIPVDTVRSDLSALRGGRRA